MAPVSPCGPISPCGTSANAAALPTDMKQFDGCNWSIKGRYGPKSNLSKTQRKRAHATIQIDDTY